jgi:hypothetical protein
MRHLFWLSLILLAYGCQALKNEEMGSSVNESSPVQKFVVCTFDKNNRQIRFYPQFGQIFYHRADGTQIDDQEGITFHEQILEGQYGAPAEVIMTLKNEEGEKVGSWRYLKGETSFNINFNGARTIQKDFSDCTWSNSLETPPTR